MKFEKIGPGLAALMADYKKRGTSGLQKHTKSLGIIIPPENSPKPFRIVSFLYCDHDAKFDALAKENIVVNQKLGKIRTAFFPIDSLETIAEDQRIKRIIPSHYLKLKMDVATSKANVPEFRTNKHLTGNGTIIGTVDTGIDPNHPAFAGRILNIWDQTLPGSGVAEGSYGVELSGNLLNVSRDTEGHGTHVAGIAAGRDPKFGGVASDSQYVIVKSDLIDAHIADGIRYIFRVASDMSKPAVVNLSLGGHADAHDGSDPLSRIIDTESGPGKIVCCAAGNEGNDNIHAQTKVAKNSTKSVRFVVPTSTSGAARWVGLNGWYSGSDKIAISVKSPSGFSTPFQSTISDGDPARVFDLSDGKITVSTPPPDPSNGDHNFFVVLEPHGFLSSPIDGTWKLLLQGETISNGQVDIWILDNSESQVSLFTGTSVRDTTKIGSPGCSTSAITVASYTTKTHWQDSDGEDVSIAFQLNDISEFSSEGPLRNESEKPDISAPGAFICSALSADSPLDRKMKISQGLRMMAGTSMATPFITGIVSLLLERDSHLDPSGVKSILKNVGRIPGKTQNTFDAKWGFGLIDMTLG